MRIFAALIALALPCVFIWLTGASLAGYVLLNLGFPGAAAQFFDDPMQKGIAFYRAERWDQAADAFTKASLDSPASAYNLGNALAQAHRFEDAVAAYDQVLAAAPDNQDAAFNKALLIGLIETEQMSIGTSSGAANAAANRTRRAHNGDQTGAETKSIGDGFAGAQEGASSEGAPGTSKASKAGAQSRPSSQTGEGTGAAGSAEGVGRTGGQLVDFAKLFQERERRYRRRLEERSIVPTLEWLSTLPDDPGRFLKLRILAEKARRSKNSSTPGDDD